jgi:hypothetical protein
LCSYVVLSCVGRDLCDGLITRPKESYYVSNTTEKPKEGHRKTSIDTLTRKEKSLVSY